MSPFWTRQLVAAEYDRLIADVEAAAGAAGALDVLVAEQDPPPGTPQAYWAAVQEGLVNEQDPTGTVSQQLRAMKLALVGADDAELADQYLGISGLMERLTGELRQAQYFGGFSEAWGPTADGTARAMAAARESCHRLITALGDLRRNERLAASRAASGS